MERGETFVIIGPSGCGKTTLLKAMAGFMRPASGTLRIIKQPGETYEVGTILGEIL